MPIGLVTAGIGAAASLAGGAMQARATENATDAATGLQREMYDRTEQRLQPWTDAGGEGLGAYMNELGFTESGYNAPDLPDMSYDAMAEGFQESPGYQYALEQGQQAIQNSAAARGNLHSGNTQLELLRHAMGVADQGFNNYYNMNRQGVMDNHNMRQQQLSRLESLTNSGAQAATQQGQFGANMATNVGSMMMQGGMASSGAMAGGIAGAANSVNAGLNSAMNQSLLQAAYPDYQPPTVRGLFGMGAGGGDTLAPTSSMRPEMRGV